MSPITPAQTTGCALHSILPPTSFNHHSSLLMSLSRFYSKVTVRLVRILHPCHISTVKSSSKRKIQTILRMVLIKPCSALENFNFTPIESNFTSLSYVLVDLPKWAVDPTVPHTMTWVSMKIKATPPKSREEQFKGYLCQHRNFRTVNHGLCN